MMEFFKFPQHKSNCCFIGIFCTLFDIFSETKTGAANTDTTADNLVVNTHTHTPSCQTGGCQHVLTPRPCCQVLRTEGEGGRDVIK